MATSTFLASTWKTSGSSCKNMRSHHAFTLIELMVVLAIAAILASVVGIRAAGYFRAAKSSRIMDKLVEADRQARVLASTRGTVEVQLEFRGSQIELRSQNVLQDNARRTYEIPSGFELRVRTNRRQDVATLDFRRGHSSTYAVEVRNNDEPLFWFVTLGASGQSFPVQNEAEVTSLLALSQEKKTGRPLLP